ncbi:uncharacterized protein LOC121650578 [Melanotaenia boesemani]|uniref:uncharacterized protein LOC121650578 n=1 Tax=Melanotaenia boesemani TaxID=1250792 RepID=UPI001C04E9C5|nr:uncharacterized protein LOC121650578 [Melanotaenia boesemani]
MSAEVAQWCQACKRCQMAKDNQPVAHSFMGHLLASRPNEIRHKIQDQWAPEVYCIVRAPNGGGPVYTIAAENDPTKTRQVHRSLLKPVVGGDSPGGAASPALPPPRRPQVEEESSFDGDLLVSLPPDCLSAPPRAAAVIPTTSQPLPSQPTPGSSSGPASSVDGALAASSSLPPHGVEEPLARRTALVLKLKIHHRDDDSTGGGRL